MSNTETNGTRTGRAAMEIHFGTFNNGKKCWTVTVDGGFLYREGPYGHRMIRTWGTQAGAERFVANA